MPFWSPDGRSIAFFADNKLKRIDVGGPASPGRVITLCSAKQGLGGDWSRDGVILFATQEGIYRVGDKGGSPVPVTKTEAGTPLFPWFLPDGNHFLFVTARTRSDRVLVQAGSLDSKASKVLFEADSNAMFSGGRLLYVREGTLFAQPFSARKLMITGAAIPLVDQIEPFGRWGNFSAAENGPLVYFSTGGVPPLELVWLDRSGTRLSTVGGVWPTHFRYPPNLSPDERTVALADRELNNSDIWLFGTEEAQRTRVTLDPAKDVAPIWSPDGQGIAFASARKGRFDLYRRASYGSQPEQLLYADGYDKYPTSWSPDGKYLLYDLVANNDMQDETSLELHSSIWVLPLSVEAIGDRLKPFPLQTTTDGDSHGQFSPDGRWVAYESKESGRSEIYVVPFRTETASPGWRRQVSTTGGASVRWRRDGREIFYQSGRRLLSAAINTKGDNVRLGEEQQIIGPFSILAYDVSSDGLRFLVQIRTDRLASQPLTVLQNWAAGLGRQ